MTRVPPRLRRLSPAGRDARSRGLRRLMVADLAFLAAVIVDGLFIGSRFLIGYLVLYLVLLSLHVVLLIRRGPEMDLEAVPPARSAPPRDPKTVIR